MAKFRMAHILWSPCAKLYVSDTQLATWKPFLNSYVEKENFHYCIYFFLNIYLVISVYLAVSHLSCSMWDLQSLWQHAVSFICGMQALVPWPGIKPGPPDSGAWSLSHWTTSPAYRFFIWSIWPTLCKILNIKESHIPWELFLEINSHSLCTICLGMYTQYCK